MTVPLSALQPQPYCDFVWSCSDSPGLCSCAFEVLSPSSDRVPWQLLWVSHSCGLLIRTCESWVNVRARPRVLSALVRLPGWGGGHSERSQDLDLWFPIWAVSSHSVPTTLSSPRKLVEGVSYPRASIPLTKQALFFLSLHSHRDGWCQCWEDKVPGQELRDVPRLPCSGSVVHVVRNTWKMPKQQEAKAEFREIIHICV